MNGDYDLTWNIYEALMDQTGDKDNFLYEDIVFARSNSMTDKDYFKTSREFLEYCSGCEDDDFQDDSDDDSDDEMFVNEKMERVVEAWAELGYRYFYQLGDDSQALECFTREKELSKSYSPMASLNSNPMTGSHAERMADIYAFRHDLEKSLPLYQDALEVSLKSPFVVNLMATARCMCKIGWCRSQHDPSTFRDAFQYLLQGHSKPYVRDTIGKCYMYLSRSLQRCQRYDTALKYAQQALSIFSRDPLMLERLVERCHEWIASLQRLKGGDALVETLHQEDRPPLNDEEIKRMLETTLTELKAESSK